MRKYIFFSFLICLICFSCKVYPVPQQQLLIPFYNYPIWWDSENYLWDDIAEANQISPMTVIINPNNGPDGCPPNSDYQQGIADLQTADVTMLGYVPTNYAQRPLVDVQADIDEYLACYQVDGIMFDEVASGQADVAYYAFLKDYTRQYLSNASIVLNFGVEPHQDYLLIDAAILVIFEGTASQFQLFSPSPWMPGNRSAVFIYDTPLEEIDMLLSQIYQHEISYFFITSDMLPNPWDTLPEYFDILVESTVPVPELGTYFLFGTGLGIIAFFLLQKQHITKNSNHPG